MLPIPGPIPGIPNAHGDRDGVKHQEILCGALLCDLVLCIFSMSSIQLMVISTTIPRVESVGDLRSTVSNKVDLSARPLET